MIAEICIIFVALLNGGWMVFDGVHVLRKGKYFGPNEPGPWSKLVSKVGIDPLSIGPVFVLLGLGWLVGGTCMIAGFAQAWLVLAIVGVLTLWYISIGTMLSIIVLVLLFVYHGRFV